MSTTETPSPAVTPSETSSPLFPLHEEWGATWATAPGLDGRPVAAHFGEPETEYRALTEGAGFLDRSFLDRLEMTGEDRHRFLNGQVTCELAGLEAGSLAYGFFTSRQGKIQADVTVLAQEDRFWLELPPGRGEAQRDHLQKYILADRVAVEPLTSVVPLAVAGTRAFEVLESSGIAGLPAEDGRHVETELFGVAAPVVRQPVFTLPAVTFWLPAGRAAEVAGRLHEEGVRHGLVPVGLEALETVRVERGAPRFGADFGPEHFPQESGLDHAVSFTKGCYLGQEVVARIHYRGGVNRHLRGLVFEGIEGNEVPASGAELAVDGRSVGTVGTAVRSPALGAVVGLAVLHQRAEPGAKVEVAGGGSAEVRKLPWVS